MTVHGKAAKVSVSPEAGRFAGMLWKEIYKQLNDTLQLLYPTGEAEAVARLIVETWGHQPLRSLLEQPAPGELEDQLPGVLHDLLQHKPVQYILQQAWFYKYPFYITPAVLIPRPETEELVAWILQETKPVTPDERLRVLDIGTGSGCIAVTLANEISAAEVSAIEISEEALAVAQENAKRLNSPVTFQQLNFLQEEERSGLGQFDIIVSNPPYIAEQEKTAIQPNVSEHEPHLALFVPDSDPLLFYKAIASFAKEHLSKNGTVYVEINQLLGKETKAVFEERGFNNVQLIKDLSGNDRMIKACYNIQQ